MGKSMVMFNLFIRKNTNYLRTNTNDATFSINIPIFKNFLTKFPPPPFLKIYLYYLFWCLNYFLFDVVEAWKKICKTANLMLTNKLCVSLISLIKIFIFFIC